MIKKSGSLGKIRTYSKQVERNVTNKKIVHGKMIKSRKDNYRSVSLSG